MQPSRERPRFASRRSAALAALTMLDMSLLSLPAGATASESASSTTWSMCSTATVQICTRCRTDCSLRPPLVLRTGTRPCTRRAVHNVQRAD